MCCISFLDTNNEAVNESIHIPYHHTPKWCLFLMKSIALFFFNLQNEWYSLSTQVCAKVIVMQERVTAVKSHTTFHVLCDFYSRDLRSGSFSL